MAATTKVVLRCNIPTKKLKFGDEADLPDKYAKKLLGEGLAITVEDAKKLTEAETVMKTAAAREEAAKANVEAIRAKSLAATKSANAKAKAEAEARREAGKTTSLKDKLLGKRSIKAEAAAKAEGHSEANADASVDAEPKA